MFRSLLFCTALLMAPAMPSFAQSDEEKEQRRFESVVVTGAMRVTQGGAQDIKSFRGSIGDGQTIPQPGALTAEGLLSEYDLSLAESGPCRQLFCLSAETMAADLIGLPNASAIMALGFGTNLDAETWERDPLTLVAVVDKSGSMSGEPLDNAKYAMQLALTKLREGDRMAVLAYGSNADVVIPVMDVSTGRQSISAAIDNIHSDGVTAMEAGLSLAFDTARESQPDFKGRTRVMLFTDERPNVGRTDSASFMEMAKTASADGIGLTTIGVSDQFGAELANKISSVRGGNLFFVRSQKDVDDVFNEGFDFLVTELAHDLSITITPKNGATIESVYGVPGNVLEHHPDGSVSVTVPSVFLSNNGGALMPVLSGNDPSVDVSLTYLGLDKIRGEDSLSISALSPAPGSGLQTAALLLDEYVLLNRASTQFHSGKNVAQVSADLERLAHRLGATKHADMQQEVKLLLQTKAALDEQPQLSKLHGDWVIQRVANRSHSITGKASIDIRKDDLITFDFSDSNYPFWELQRLSARNDEEEFERETLGMNDNQIYLEHSEILFSYRFFGEKLRLHVHNSDLHLTLVRPNDPAS